MLPGSSVLDASGNSALVNFYEACLSFEGVGASQRVIPVTEHPVQRIEQLALTRAAVLAQQLTCARDEPMRT